MSIDIILFSIFLSLNFIVGILAGRRVKSLRDFSIGNKTFSTSTVTSTIVATWIGGGFMFYTLQNIYTSGLQFIIVTMAGSLGLLVMGQVLAIRMGEFLNNLSIAEAMRDLYGKHAQTITAIFGIMRTIGSMAVQFKVIAKMFIFLLGIQENPWLTVLAAGVVVLYSAFGGVRSVTITDIFQFITFSVFIPILALIVWRNLKNPAQVITLLDTNPLFSWKSVFGWNAKTLSMLGLLLYFALPGLTPPIFQRISISKDVQQVKDSFTYAAGIMFLIVLGVAWVAILLLAEPSVKDPSNLLNYLISHYAYDGLKGLIATGVVAMAMSTADSNLNAAAVLLVNDLIQPWKKNWQPSMLVVRLASIGLGMLGLLLALRMQNILEVILFAASFFVAVVDAPLLLAIFGFRSSPRSALIGMAAGLVTVILWSIFLKNSDSVIPGLLVNLVFLLGSHYLLKEEGGWLGIKEPAPLLIARQKRKAMWADLLEAFKMPRLYAYLKDNIPVNGAVYPLFGIYVIGATYTSFFTVSEAVIANHEALYNFLTHSTLIATAVFITYPAWPNTFKAKWFIAFAWPLGIMYLLFVVGAMVVMMSGFHQVQVMIFMLNLIIAALLLHWPLVAITSVLGIILARFIFHTYGGEIVVTGPVTSLQFKIFYSIVLFSGSFMAIVRFRQSKKNLERRHERLIENNQEISVQLLKALSYEERFIQALGIEGIKELDKTTELSQEVKAWIESVDLQTLSVPLREALSTLKQRINTTAQYLGDISHRATAYLHLDVKNITLKDLVHEVSELLEVTELPVIPQVIVRIETSLETQTVECDVNKIKKMLFNGIIYAQTHLTTQKPVILLGIETTHLGYIINSIEGYTKKVPAVRFTITTDNKLPACESFYVTNMGMDHNALKVPMDQQSMVLFANQRVLQAHYGYMALAINSEVVTQVYIIPQQIREVRPKEMDIPELEPDAVIQESDENYPGAKEQEQSLLNALKLEREEDIKMVHKAIRLIKKYHGPVKRKSGEPFYLHPVTVAKIILDYTDDLDTIIGALLHDIVEDTALTLSQIELMFNTNIKNIVDGVTHLDSRQRNIYKIKLAAHENIKQLLEVEDKRVLYVKLADRMHNMRTIQFHSSLAKRKAIAEETLQFFVPIAQFLGLTEAAKELKTLSFDVLNQ